MMYLYRWCSSSPAVLRGCAASTYTVRMIQPRKDVVDHADYMAPIRQHGLDHTKYIYRSGIDHTDHTDHTDQESIFPAWQI